MIGLTGGIASGKSTVSRRLAELGAAVFDADEVSREVIASEEVLSRIREAFGDGVFGEDGSLSRPALAREVFASDENALLLDSIMHPAIAAELKKRARDAEESGAPLVFVDAALLIESGFYKLCSEVWLVTASYETRIKRIMERDGLTREEAAARISRQMPEEEKRRYADTVIENDGGLSELIARTDWELARAYFTKGSMNICSNYEEDEQS